MNPIKLLNSLDACSEGIKFVSKYDSLESAWNACRRGDWMLWLAFKLKVPIKTLTLAKGLCANTVRHLMKDKRSIAAVDAAIAFGRGKISEEELKKAASTAYASYADAAAYASYAAAASYASSAAADAASYAAAYASYASANKTNQRQTADICRKVLTRSVLARIGGMVGDGC